jgi:DNA polymerase I
MTYARPRSFTERSSQRTRSSSGERSYGAATRRVSRRSTGGTPIDLPLYREIVENLPAISCGLMNRDAINREIYADGTFNMRHFAQALRDRGIVRWPQTEMTRALRTDRRTLETMVLRHNELAPVRDLKSLLDVLDEQTIMVGPSGRNRCFQGPFIAKTGRDAPRGRIWNQASWWFHLIRPEPGTSLIHADYKAQEFGTLAVLSGDPVMLNEYPRDPFTIRAKAANLPRSAVKTATFAKFYGAGLDRLAEVLGRGNVPAFESSMSVYRRAWQWLARRTLRARNEHKIETYYGWRLAVTSATKAPTLKNYPIQGNAGEITRLALIYAVAAGLRICAVIHDALVAECERGKEAETMAVLRDVMERASRQILGGYTLMITFKTITDHYEDERGKGMWEMVMNELEAVRTRARWHGLGVLSGSRDPTAAHPAGSETESPKIETPEAAESDMVG